MFWFIILLLVLVIVGASWLAGTMINRKAERRRNGPRMTRQQPLSAAKLSGAFPSRKED